MELFQLKLFIEIAAQGSLTKASISLDAEQSAISRQLSALEAELGSRLFHRTGRGMTLTDFGASLYPRAKGLLADADQLVEEIRSVAGIVSGEVRLGILPAFSFPLIVQLKRLLRDQHPNLHLQLFEGSNGQLTEWIALGRIDLAVLYRYDEVDTSEVKVLGSTDACLISCFDDPITAAPEVPFEALRGLPLVLPSRPNSLRVTLDDLAKARGFTLEVALEADSLPIQKDMILDGGAYAILGPQAILREREGKLLRASRIVDPPISRTAILATSGQRPYTGAMRVVAKALEPLMMEVLNPSVP